MRIDFGRCYALMPEHGLDDTQAGTAFKKMSGKGVTEGVRTDILLDAGIKDKLLYEVEYHNARERFLESFADKYIILKIGFDCYQITINKVMLKFFDGSMRYWD